MELSKCYCGKKPRIVKVSDKRYDVICNCGRFMPCVKSENDCYKYWNAFIEKFKDDQEFLDALQ